MYSFIQLFIYLPIYLFISIHSFNYPLIFIYFSLLFLDILQLIYSLRYTSIPFLKGCRLEKGHIVPVLCSHL